MHTDNRAELQELIGPDYQLQWIIGHGGMSTVWLADDTTRDREVAVKVLRPEFSANEEFLSRFRNEANAAEGINSENVVATYDYREVPTREGYPMCFIVMEYIRGESLADLIVREGQLTEAMALDVLEQAAHGLSVIHRMGLVHRDIKPGNLMITQNGKVKITDFGIAKAASAVPLTRTGMVVGTAQYVSPEQAQGLPVTAASDIYSLGVVGYELLSGRRPFTGDSSVSVALAHVSNEAPPLSTSISAPARELIGIAMRKDPATRFADGSEFQNAIADARNGQRPVTRNTRAVSAPSPQESTAQLAAVTEATTIQPETGPAPSYQQDYPQDYPELSEHQTPAVDAEPKKRSGGFGTGVLIALVVLLLGLGAFWAYTSGLLDGLIGGGEETSSSTSSTTVTTETTETTVEETTEQSTPSSEPEETQRSTQEEPSTIYNSPEPSTSQSSREEQPAPQPTREEPPAPQPENPVPPAPELPDLPNPFE